ncbi:hypothetical protein BGX23_001583, partial [Mortierella sp. AD031]
MTYLLVIGSKRLAADQSITSFLKKESPQAWDLARHLTDGNQVQGGGEWTINRR